MNEENFEILIVDDNPENLKVLGALLKPEGYHIRVAKDGYQALASLIESEPDMMLLDIHMPKMDGFEVCKRIRSKPINSKIPVFFISALGDSFNKKLGFDSGATDYITKPFDAEEIKVRIKLQLIVKSKLQKIKELEIELKSKNEEIKKLKSELRMKEQ